MIDQGFTGLVLELLKSGGTDVDWQGVGLGFQMPGAFSQYAKHDLAHAGYFLLVGSIFGLLRGRCVCGWIRGTGPADTFSHDLTVGTLRAISGAVGFSRPQVC